MSVAEDSAAAPQEVLYEVRNHIATITLNAPDRMNTISAPMLNQLTDCLLEADSDPEGRSDRCVAADFARSQAHAAHGAAGDGEAHHLCA